MEFSKLRVIGACNIGIEAILKEQQRIKAEEVQEIFDYNEGLKTKGYWSRMWYTWPMPYENLTHEMIADDFHMYSKFKNDWYCEADAEHPAYKRNTLKKLNNILVLTRVDKTATIDLDRDDSLLVQKVIEGIVE